MNEEGGGKQAASRGLIYCTGLCVRWRADRPGGGRATHFRVKLHDLFREEPYSRQETRGTIEMNHFFSERLPRFGSLRPLPKTDFEEKRTNLC